jgi:hypothetical protein
MTLAFQDIQEKNSGSLWVCWVIPERLPRTSVRVLSLLPPALEDEFRKVHADPFIVARELSLSVRAEARKLYLELLAQTGLVQDHTGLTLRRSLARPPTSRTCGFGYGKSLPRASDENHGELFGTSSLLADPL